MEELGAAGLPSHVEPIASPSSDPELAKKYPEILLTGARQVEYIDAQQREVAGLRVRVPEALAEISPVTAKKYDVIDGEMIGVGTRWNNQGKSKSYRRYERRRRFHPTVGRIPMSTFCWMPA